MLYKTYCTWKVSQLVVSFERNSEYRNINIKNVSSSHSDEEEKQLE